MSKALIDILSGESLVDQVRRIRTGLKAPRHSAEHKYAWFVTGRIFGPPAAALLISTTLIWSLFHFVTGEQIGSDREIEVQTVDPETVKLDDLKIEEMKVEEMTEEVVDSPVVTPGPAQEYSVPSDVAGAGVDGDQDTPMVDFAPVLTSSPLVMRGVYANRTKGGRGDALRMFNLSGVNTEAAVLRALTWLKNHQNKDGSWGPQYPAAMTGLALLSFLAHGETTSSEDYGETVRRGLRWLIAHQEKGRFVGGGPGPAVQISCYEHAIATYAVSESYGLTTIPFLKSSMEQAVQIILDGQNDSGSWDYGYERGPKANVDVSLAGWHIQALKAALAAGADNKGLESSLDNAIRGLTLMMDKAKPGAFRYSTRTKDEGPTMPMTGVAVLCMQLAHHGNDAEAKAGFNVLKDIGFRWTRGEQNQDQRLMSEWPLYGWYYITQVRFQGGGAQWNTWNKQLAPVLVRMQNPDGSWCMPPNSAEGGYGPVYCTALGALIIEVYYRFLPTFQKIEPDETAKPKDDKSEDEEIVVKFG